MVGLIKSRGGKAAVLAIACLLLIASLLMSILIGYQSYSLAQLWETMTRFDGSNEHLLIKTVRMPAAIIGMAVGASLAIAGTIMQAVTRNPLASPSILGINAGAVLAIMFVLLVTGLDLAMQQMVWVALAGAAFAALLVTVLGAVGSGGLQPIKLTLAGAAFAAFASSITSGIMLIRNESLTEALFWLIGSLAGRKLELLTGVLPYLSLGLLLALALSRSLNIIEMGDEVAKGLGQWTLLVKLLSLVSVILLAGVSVALAGPIAFIGLIAPHICRFLIGGNHIWLIPFSGIFGATLLVSADLLSRLVLMPKQVPVGVTTALLGVPFLIYLARWRTT